MKTAMENQKVIEILEEIRTLRDTHHGFLIALARSADINFSNLSTIVQGKRKIGYKAFYALQCNLPKVKRLFLKENTKKV